MEEKGTPTDQQSNLAFSGTAIQKTRYPEISAWLDTYFMNLVTLNLAKNKCRTKLVDSRHMKYFLVVELFNVADSC